MQRHRLCERQRSNPVTPARLYESSEVMPEVLATMAPHLSGLPRCCAPRSDVGVGEGR